MRNTGITMLIRNALLLLAISVSGMTPANAVVAISGSSSINSLASLQGTGADADSDTDAFTGVGGRREVNITSGVGTDDHGAFVFGRTYNTFVAPNYGILDFTRQITLIGQGPLLKGGFDGLAAPDWTYVFRAEKAGDFFIDYDVLAFGPTSRRQGWTIEWSGPGGGLYLRNTVDPTAKGRFARLIDNGSIYTVSLRNNASVESKTARNRTLIGQFSWSVAEAYVPEPATWMLMIGGFGLVGTALRRRRVAGDRRISPR